MRQRQLMDKMIFLRSFLKIAMKLHKQRPETDERGGRGRILVIVQFACCDKSRK